MQRKEAARWLGPLGAVLFVLSVALLPWVRATGTLVGDRRLTFWDLRPGLQELGFPWSLLGEMIPMIFIALAVAAVAGQTVAENLNPGDRNEYLWLAGLPMVWAALVTFQINDAISDSNRLGLGPILNFNVGVGAWLAIGSGLAMCGAVFLATDGPEQAWFVRSYGRCWGMEAQPGVSRGC